MAPTQKFRDLGFASGFLTLALWVYLTATVVCAYFNYVSGLMWATLARGEWVSDEDLARHELLQSGIDVFGGLAGVVFFAALLRWVYVSKSNAWVLARGSLAYTPGWSVGWFFVPIATAWRPYQAIRETFRASHPGHAETWRDAPRPKMLPVWWACWMVSALGDFSLMMDQFVAETASQMVEVSRRQAADAVLDIPSTIALLPLIGVLRRWQRDKLERVNLG